MKLTHTKFEDVFIIHPDIKKDKRGLFYERFHRDKFNRMTGLDHGFVQDNYSVSHFGVLRGLHFQISPMEQAKLIWVTYGKVQDVVVDLRKNSPTFSQWISIVLDHTQHQQLYIPPYFGHGFLTLSKEVHFCYKCSNFYNQEAERGIHFADTDLKIQWMLPEEHIIVSQKDTYLPSLKTMEKEL